MTDSNDSAAVPAGVKLNRKYLADLAAHGPEDDDEGDIASWHAQETLILAAQELIAEALDREGYTYAQFSCLVNKPARQIRRWMSGADDLTLRALAEMLHALGNAATIGAVPVGDRGQQT